MVVTPVQVMVTDVDEADVILIPEGASGAYCAKTPELFGSEEVLVPTMFTASTLTRMSIPGVYPIDEPMN